LLSGAYSNQKPLKKRGNKRVVFFILTILV
jgi:hypothetical protein